MVYTCCYHHHRQLSNCRRRIAADQHPNRSHFSSTVDQPPSVSSAHRKLLLAVPLQRKRKSVVYNRDFIGAIGLDAHLCDKNITADHRFVLSHFTCVEKFTKMYNASGTSAPRTSSTMNTSDTAINGAVDNSQLNEINSWRWCENGSDQMMANDDKEHQPSAGCGFSLKRYDFGESETERDELMKVNIGPPGQRNSSPMSDEGCAVNVSPYSSSGEDEECPGRPKFGHEKVGRSASSDSALSMDEELPGDGVPPPLNGRRRMTLTVTDIPLRSALLPVAEPTSLPESPTAAHLPPADWAAPAPPVVVPSKMLLEARIVEIPASDPASGQASRRQSCLSEVAACEEPHHVRYMRTPSVVVSDYSDDVLCGITLEELEFFRSQRKCSLGANIELNASAIGECTDTDDLSDMSAASSCSNLNYCGSTISALDDPYTTVSGLATPERKMSNCSICSDCSNDDADADAFGSNLIDALNQQHLQTKKKVRKCDHVKAKR